MKVANVTPIKNRLSDEIVGETHEYELRTARELYAFNAATHLHSEYNTEFDMILGEMDLYSTYATLEQTHHPELILGRVHISTTNPDHIKQVIEYIEMTMKKF